MWRKGTTYSQMMGVETGAAAVETSVLVPQKAKLYLPCNPATQHLGIFLKDSISYYIDIYPFMFVTAVFIIEIENILDLCKQINGSGKCGIFS